MAVNAIELQKILIPAVAGLEANFFMKEMGSTDLTGKFTSEGGETIKVKRHGYPTVYQTNDMTGKLSGMETKSVDLSILPYMTGYSYTDIEESFELGDKDVFLGNAGKALCEDINAIAFNAAIYGASNAIVTTAADFETLSRAKIITDASKMNGVVGGVLSSDLRGQILATAKSNQAFGASSLAEKYATGNISQWNGCKWADYAANMLVTGDIFPAGTFTITNTAGISGGTVATYTPTSTVSAALTIKAGTVITLGATNAVRSVDIRGAVTSAERHFIVQADVTIPTGTGGTVVNLGDVFFAGCMKNVSVAEITALAVVNKMAASSAYYVGVVFKNTELLMAMPQIKALKGVASTATKQEDGLPLRVSFDGNAKTSTDEVIFKTMFGARLYAGLGACAIFHKVA